MATKPKRQRIVLQSAEEKAARQSLLRSAQLGLASMQGRVASATKGAFGSRLLRHAGDTLDRYNMGNYSDTLGGFLPTPPTGTPGGGGTTGGGGYQPRRSPKPKPKKGTGHSTSTTSSGRNKNGAQTHPIPPHQTPQRLPPKAKPKPRTPRTTLPGRRRQD